MLTAVPRSICRTESVGQCVFTNPGRGAGDVLRTCPSRTKLIPLRIRRLLHLFSSPIGFPRAKHGQGIWLHAPRLRFHMLCIVCPPHHPQAQSQRDRSASILLSKGKPILKIQTPHSWKRRSKVLPYRFGNRTRPLCAIVDGFCPLYLRRTFFISRPCTQWFSFPQHSIIRPRLTTRSLMASAASKAQSRRSCQYSLGKRGTHTIITLFDQLTYTLFFIESVYWEIRSPYAWCTLLLIVDLLIMHFSVPYLTTEISCTWNPVSWRFPF